MSANADALNEAAVAMSPRAAAHFVEARAQNYRRADHLFARLMVFQWVGGIVAALLLSPRTWVGAESSLHPHVIAACVLGGLITALPVYLASTRPGAASTRYSIALAQMLMSSLFVHLSGGRIETHFHVFGSLAFLAFYRDWRVLLIGTVVAGLDHAVRGILWPQTIFGVLSASNWRTLEHVGWVIFEDIVLWISIRQGVAEMKQIAIRQASLETAEEDLQQAHDELETRVQERTAEIATMNAALLEENVHRQRAEDTLRASEERFQLVARATEDAVWDRDMITGSVSYSEWFGKHFGYGAAQLQSSDAVEVSRIHPDDRAGVLGSLDAFFAGHEQVWSAEYRYRCADGAFASVYDRAVVVRAPDGKPLRIVGSMMNITERKRTESALRRLAAIVESSDDAILSNDLNGIVMSWNQGAEKVFGYTAAEMVGTSIMRIIPAAFRDDEIQLTGKIKQGHSVEHFETGRRTKNGRLITVAITASPIRDGSGEVIGASKVVRDITERVRQDDERRIVAEIAHGALATSNLRELLDLAHRSIGSLLYAENCFVALHDPRTDLLNFEFWVDKCDPVPAPQPIGKGLSHSSYVLRTGKPLIVTPEVAAQMHEHGDVLLIGSDSPSWLGVPLRTPSGTIGVLAVQHYEQEGVYSQRDLEFLASIGDQVALAIERKRAADLLKRSEQGLAAAQRMAHVGNWETEIATGAVTWSEETYRIYEKNEACCDPTHEAFLECVHPQDREAVATALQASLGQPGIHTIEHRLLMPDGRVKFVEERWETLADDDGKSLRAIGTCQDITVAKHAATALRGREELLRRVMDSSQDCIKILDLEGRLLWMNEGGKDIMEIDDFDAVQNTIWCDLWPADEQAAPRAALELARSSQIGRFNGFCPTAKATPRWWEVVVTPVLNGQGSPEKILSVSRDITVRRQAEVELLRAKDAAEAATRAKSEFLANMSHEIRTPMNGILGMTELTLDTELNHEQREYLGMVKTSAHSLLGVINDILDFSKIEAGKLDMEAISFSIRQTIGAMLKPLGMRAAEKHVELVADIPGNVPDHLIGDPLRLRQILLNLTDNAIKFTAKGEVVVRVTAAARTDGETELHFSVTDTGIGIPLEKQAAIFDAFSQVDGSTTRHYGGTGLGLAIATRLVQQMRGRIWVESEMGSGTAFHFTILLPTSDEPMPESKQVDRAKLKGLRVLIVDDNAVNCRILEETLANWQMQPAAVCSGRAAFEAMQAAADAGEAYPLVLLDVMMPEMDGFALAEEIQRTPSLGGATVMMLSSAVRTGEMKRASALGVQSVLTKPVMQSELLEAILLSLSGNELVTLHGQHSPAIRNVPTKCSLDILVAEDNVINRAVISGMLSKQGHRATHVVSGLAAIDAITTKQFDLVFMDIQMPDMDGLEATLRIRQLEERTAQHTKIVAMTAHAMEGDRERCLAAGMDDYISKPIRADELQRVLRTIEAALPAPLSEAPSARVHTQAELRDICNGDDELVSELIALFRSDTPQLMNVIQQAATNHDSAGLAAGAHKLLSSLGTFGATDACEMVRTLEGQGRSALFDGAEERVRNLEREIDLIHACLAQYVPGSLPGPAAMPAAEGLGLAEDYHVGA